MKVLAINGSARGKGNTYAMLNRVLEGLSEAGHDTEIINLAGKDVRGCTVCLLCRKHKDGRCHGRDDFISEIMPKVWEADVLLLGSPTYFADVSTEMKAFIDRIGYVAMGNGGLLKRKIGAAVVAARRGGAIHVFDTMNHLFTINQMIVVGSSYWNDGYGAKRNAVLEDEEALRTCDNLAANIAWLAEKIEGA